MLLGRAGGTPELCTDLSSMEFAAGAGAEPGSKPGQKTAACQATHSEEPAAGSTQGGQDLLGGQQVTQAKPPSKLEPAAGVPDDLQGHSQLLRSHSSSDLSYANNSVMQRW